jgi:hypothetical protein
LVLGYLTKQATGYGLQATGNKLSCGHGLRHVLPCGLSILTLVVQKKETLLAERQTKDAIFGDVLVLQR